MNDLAATRQWLEDLTRDLPDIPASTITTDEDDTFAFSFALSPPSPHRIHFGVRSGAMPKAGIWISDGHGRIIPPARAPYRGADPLSALSHAVVGALVDSQWQSAMINGGSPDPWPALDVIARRCFWLGP